MAAGPGPLHRRRRLVAAAALLGAAALAAALLLARGEPGDDRRLAPAAGDGPERYDPLAYDDERRAELERRAAAGFSHVLYAKSPGGAPASAARTARWRAQVERAARAGGADPDLLEALVMLESAGRPDAIAGDDPESAAGLTQILAGTAVDLLGMRVDLARSRALTRRIGAAAARGDEPGAERLRARRRRVDDRFDPARALAGAARYLAIARERFGRDDLAVVSYHMGIGNLETALRAYAGERDAPIAEVVEEHDLSYARLYFGSTPLVHARAYASLARLGDDSATYLWRVLAAREIMRLQREAPAELERLAALHLQSASAERALHPDPEPAPAGALARPPADLEPFGLALDAATGGELALRPAALSALLVIGAGTLDASRARPLVVARAAGGRGGGDGALHAAGYAFDVERSYRSRGQALAFEFMLTRLQALNLITWRRDGERIHVAVARDAGELLPDPERLAADRERPEPG